MPGWPSPIETAWRAWSAPTSPPRRPASSSLIGAEVTLADASPVLLWAMNREGYGRLCRLLTRGRRQAPKGECRLAFADVAEHASGLLVGVLAASGRRTCRRSYRGGGKSFPIEPTPWPSCIAACAMDGDWTSGNARPRRRGCRLIAAGDVHYHDASRRYLQDVLTAIRLKTTVAELGAARFPNGERRLRPLDELLSLFAQCPAAVSRTAEVADRCTFSLDELRYEYPEELCPAGETPSSYLARLTWAGAQERYPDGVPTKVSQLIERELAIIEELNYAAYFLTVWDLVRFARVAGHPLPGTRLGGQLGRLLLPGSHLR